MDIRNRRPRRSRFASPHGDSSREAQVARLREQAPSLGSNRRLRSLALFGSALMVLAVAGFYYTLQVLKAVSQERPGDWTMEVERAPEIPPSAIEEALQRIEEDRQQAEADYQQQLKELQRIDLLGEEGEPPAPHGRGEPDA